jgi:hypothetical protein
MLVDPNLSLHASLEGKTLRLLKGGVQSFKVTENLRGRWQT